MKKIITWCGAALLAQFPAGCVPPGAELLDESQKAELLQRLDATSEHLDLLATVVDHGERQLINYDDASPSIEELKEHWEEGINRGREMVRNDQVYIISDADAEANDSSGMDNANGLAHQTVGSAGEFIVFRSSAYDLQLSEFMGVMAHELDHAIDPNLFRNHDPELEEMAAIESPDFDTTTAYMDVPYQDTHLFPMYGNLLTATAGGDYTQMMLTDIQQDPARFTLYYDTAQEQLQDLKHDPQAWAQNFIDQFQVAEEHNGQQTELPEADRIDEYVALSHWDYFGAIGHMGDELQIQPEGWVDILSSQPAEFLREQAFNNTSELLQTLRTECPEQYAEYQRAHNVELRREMGKRLQLR